MNNALYSSHIPCAIVDFHTHILPGADDGSKSCEESVQMIRALANSGVSAIALTPHFYADRDNPESFIRRRRFAYENLKDALLKENLKEQPRLILGAELEYFEGITVMSELSAFKMGDGGCLLLEMPYGTWSSHIIDDVLQLNSRGDCRIVLAHVERYIGAQKKDRVKKLLDSGVLMQSNASFFLHRRTLPNALRMLKKGMINLIGSDCHNMTTRPPNIGEALNVISKYAGENTVFELMNTAEYLIGGDICGENKSYELQVQ